MGPTSPASWETVYGNRPGAGVRICRDEDDNGAVEVWGQVDYVTAQLLDQALRSSCRRRPAA
jgi:hypothetical protein